ncbi:MAG: HAD-IA family hydrolase [Verrucomicrobiota bacterium]
MKVDLTAAVYFDAGHTLLHPRQSVGLVYSEVAERFGVKEEAELLDAGFRVAWKKLKVPSGENVRRDEKEWWKRIVRETWRDSELMEQLPFNDYFETVYQEFARPELWSVYPDVWELLEWINKHGITCGILSNWDDRLHPLLSGHGLARYFDPVIISAEHGVSKPSPDIFKIAEALTSDKCNKYLLVGDDAECDQEGAKNAGWEFYHVQRPHQNLTNLLNLFAKSYLE